MNSSQVARNGTDGRMEVLVQSKIGNPKLVPGHDRRSKISTGLTLIEIMVVVLLIAIAVLGAMGFRVYCVTDAKKADVQVNAARIGSMLLETWKGQGGFTGTVNMNLLAATVTNSSPQYVLKSPAASAPAPGLPFSVAKYEIQDTSNNVYYYVTLSYKAGTLTPPTLWTAAEPEALNATISWNQGYATSGTVAHTITMTTYQD